MNMNIYTRDISTRLRRIEEKYYILNFNNVYQINEMGVIIMKYIGKDININELALKISDKYNFKDIDKIVLDIKDFLKFLLDNKLIIKHE